MTPLAAGLDYFDLHFTGQRGFIATGLVHGAEGVALIDPGPSTSLPVVRAALAERGFTTADIHWILLTHIHLDHAGATGLLLKECPHARVLVHERGVRHLVDPSKLIASATILYAERMHALWGDILPVPEANIDALGTSAQAVIAGYDVDIAYTPGHASHHVSFFFPHARVAFVGDTAGTSQPNSTVVRPLTAPPETDLEAWRASTDTILGWNPDTLFLTHCGPQRAPRLHFQEMWKQMDDWSAKVQTSLTREGSDADKAAAFHRAEIERLAHHVPRAEADIWATGARFDLSWMGLARYWKKKAAATS